MPRKANGESTIYLGKDGKWHGRVTMGIRDDGSPDRRHVERKTENEVSRAVRKLERERDSGNVRKAGQKWTVAKWLTHWVETIAAPSVRYNTMVGYRAAVYKHLIPGLGAHRLDRLEPEHLERLYARMMREGAAAGTAHQTHRTVKTALNQALRRGHISRNVASLAKAPRLDDHDIDPFTVDEAQRLLAVAATQRNGVRFALALALGLRKGEALGLRWNRVDLDKGVLRTPKQLQRQKWQHGCADPAACGERLHKRQSCRQPCNRHGRTCPPPCEPDCVRHAMKCPKRHGGGLVEVDVKSRAGKRAVGIPAPLLKALREHRAAQEKEREAAGPLWERGDWVFTQPSGRPIDRGADQRAWKALLQAAGVRDARLHDARHTAATMLLVLGVPTRAVMEVMGWSQMSMTTRYQHVTAELVAGIAQQVEGLLWRPKEGLATDN
ncbi:tyrosine-type recombinase/integrase [Amorphoplanes digitatis]|uniref:Integrase n=1 Tax=Actinoplanes digitatis TaxID=1868 RepID=A0A7W7MTE6_9ACTN|nr:tyrosine-type recombinase/integrase [Actinoplanes digitatis]MBB4765697.1 integrase [Actinoplanes digitatis]GID98034.1 site-specific integrase [Actinoplanes digitatis]